MAECDFNNDEMRCAGCGFRAGGKNWRKICEGVLTFDNSPAKAGLGDRISTLLSAVGLTEEFAKKWLGPECGCKARRDKLNKLGDYLAGRAARLGLA